MNNASRSHSGSKICSSTIKKRRLKYRKVIIEGLTSSSTDSSSSQDASFTKFQRHNEHNSMISGNTFQFVTDNIIHFCSM